MRGYKIIICPLKEILMEYFGKENWIGSLSR